MRSYRDSHTHGKESPKSQRSSINGCTHSFGCSRSYCLAALVITVEIHVVGDISRLFQNQRLMNSAFPPCPRSKFAAGVFGRFKTASGKRPRMASRSKCFFVHQSQLWVTQPRLDDPEDQETDQWRWARSEVHQPNPSAAPTDATSGMTVT